MITVSYFLYTPVRPGDPCRHFEPCATFTEEISGAGPGGPISPRGPTGPTGPGSPRGPPGHSMSPVIKMQKCSK